MSAKAVLLFTMIISVPLTIHYLGTERYALWMVISTSLGMLTFSDLGIGNGLLNAIAHSHGEGDTEAAQRYISSAFFMLAGISLSLLLVLGSLYNFVPWARLFAVHSQPAVREAGPAALVFVLCFLIGLPIGVVQRVESGYQNGFIYDIWAACGSLLGLGGLIVAVHLRAGLPWLVLAITGAPVLANLLNATYLFSFRHPELRPRWSNSSQQHMKQLFLQGLLFFILQVCVVVSTGADTLIISHLLGPSAVTSYAIATRMLTVIPSILIMVLLPLWPAYGESIARGDVRWARNALLRSLKLILICTVLSGSVFVLFGQRVLQLWVGDSFEVSRALLISMSVSLCLSTCAAAISVFLNGAKKMRVQVASALCMCISSLLLKFVLTTRLGLPGIAWSSVVAYLFFVWLPVILFLPKLLSNITTAAPSAETAEFATELSAKDAGY